MLLPSRSRSAPDGDVDLGGDHVPVSKGNEKEWRELLVGTPRQRKTYCAVAQRQGVVRKKDWRVLVLLKRFERLLIQVLMVMMAIVLVLATIDLGWAIFKDLTESPYLVIPIDQLLELFGLFMLVIIGIELLETIMKTYLTQGIAHYEVVLSVAIIAIARKVIILDVKEASSISLLGIAAIIMALTIGFFFMKRAAARSPTTELLQGKGAASSGSQGVQGTPAGAGPPDA